MNHANIEKLCSALEHPELWTGFNWTFLNIEISRPCGTAGCAIGLAKHIGIIDGAWAAELADALGITEDECTAICIPEEDGETGSYCPLYGKPFKDIQPADVAAQFRALASKHQGNNP